MTPSSIDTSFRTTGPEAMPGGLLHLPSNPRPKESFDAHLHRNEKAGRAQEKPVRKPRRENSHDEPPRGLTAAPPPPVDTKAPVEDGSTVDAGQEELPGSSPSSGEQDHEAAVERSAQAESPLPAAEAESVQLLVETSHEPPVDFLHAESGEQEFSTPPLAAGEATTGEEVSVGDQGAAVVDESPAASVRMEPQDGEPTFAPVPEAAEQADLDNKETFHRESVADPRVIRDPAPDAAPDAVPDRSHREARRVRAGRSESSDLPPVNLEEKLLETAPAVIEIDTALAPATSDHGLHAAPETTPGTAPAISPSNPADGSTLTNASRIGQHLFARGNERAAREGRLNEADQGRFLDRVARALKSAENRQDVVRLRLHPPELGSLRVELRMQQGVMTARIEAETPAARTLLIENFQALRDRLNEQGVRVESFDVDVMDRRSFDNSRSSEQRHANDDARHSTGRDGDRREGTREEEPLRPHRPLGNSGQLNVIV